MARWGEFDLLQLGDRVRFDCEADRAIKVERDGEP
jgi:hypothetical protein